MLVDMSTNTTARRQRLAALLNDPTTSDEDAQEIIAMIEALDDEDVLRRNRSLA